MSTLNGTFAEEILTFVCSVPFTSVLEERCVRDGMKWSVSAEYGISAAKF